MKIKRNDTVKILYGKDAGKKGKVLRVLPKTARVVVEGMNVFKKHLKGDGKKKEAGIIDLVKPLNIAKVMVVCPLCKKATRLGLENGQRVCKKCKKNIDKVEVVKEKKEVSKKKTVKK